MANPLVAGPSKVFVTNVIDPLFFYAVLGPENYRQEFLKSETRWGEEAKSLGPVSIENLCPGQWITAHSSHWGKLVRAKTTRIVQEAEEVDVYCLDYGTSEILPIQSIYPGLDSTGTGVVEQVMPCKLAGVKPIANNWTSRAKKFFEDCVLCQQLDMQIHNVGPDGSFCLEIIIEDEGDFKSLSEVLIEEGMAAPEKILQPQDETDSGQISKFDLTLLQRQWSITDPNTEEKTPEGPDFELEELKKSMGPSEFKYERSDDTLGGNFQPNVITVQDELDFLRERPPTKRTGREITKDCRKTTTPPRFRNKARNTCSEEVNEGQHAPGNNLSKSSPDKKSPDKSNQRSEKTCVTRGRGRSRPSNRDRTRPTGLQSYDVLVKEYEWFRFRLEDKIKKILNEVYDDIDFVTAKLKSVVYPDKSTLETFPGPKELHICLKVVLVKGVEDYQSFSNYVCQICGWFASDDAFAGEMTKVLRVLETEYVETTGVAMEEHVEAFGLVAGQLLTQASVWTEEANNKLQCCVCGFFDKWTSTNQIHSKEQGRALGSLLKAVTDEFKEIIPQELNKIYRNITDIVLSDKIPRDVKEQYLGILLDRNVNKDERHNRKEENIRDRRTQSAQTQPEQVDGDVQINLINCSQRFDRDAKGDAMLLQFDDPYHTVKRMLTHLGLLDLLHVFTSNAIRDATLFMEWNELKELLKECGLKAGQIYEIKNYLAIEKDSTIRRGSDTSSLRCSSVTSHLEGAAVNPEDDEKPLLLTPDSFINHSSGPTQSATVVNDSATTFLTTSVALNTLPPILPQKNSAFENESTTDVCNSTDETSIGLSERRTGEFLEPREQYKTESINLTGIQCDGDTIVKEKQKSKEESLNSDSEKREVTRERPNRSKIFSKGKKNSLTRNAGCSSNVLEEEDEFPILNAEKRKRKELVQQAIKQNTKSNRSTKTPSFGGRGRGKRPNFDSKH